MTGERFIPFRKTSIVTMCADDAPADERESFEAFTELLASLLHHEFRVRTGRKTSAVLSRRNE